MKYYPFIGLYTLCAKEIARFMNVYLQTIFAPVITTFLFYYIFSLSIGPYAKTVHDVPYITFLAPGLIMMAIMQNAFANPTSSLITSKIMETMRDVIIAPLTPHELVLGYMFGGVFRGILIGTLCVMLFYLLGSLAIYHIGLVLLFALLGSIFLSLIGVITGIWAEKFDHLAMISNFIIMPMTFLSGTFYTLDRLPSSIQKIAAYNPFFFIIDGFRFGFIGHTESNLTFGIIYISLLNLILYTITYFMFKTGYKLKG